MGHLDTKEELAQHFPYWGGPLLLMIFSLLVRSGERSQYPAANIQFMRQRGIPCSVATNQEKYCTAYLLEQVGFAHAFDGMFSSAHIGCLKDNVVFFEAYFGSASLEPTTGVSLLGRSG